MEILGFILAIVAGLTLGLFGGGGSILTVPIFVYILGIDPITATAYSLFVVGVASSLGAFSYMKQGFTDFKTALLILIPSLITVFITRNYLVPFLPDTIFRMSKTYFREDYVLGFLIIGILLSSSIYLIKKYASDTHNYGVSTLFIISTAVVIFITRKFLIPILPHKIIDWNGFVLSKSTLILFVFSIVMIYSGIRMTFQKNDENKPIADSKNKRLKTLLQGGGVGFLTGFVGAGGGFIIVPVLTLAGNLPLRTAVGTSLIIISINTLVGFLADIHHQAMDWHFLFTFTLFTLVGVAMGIKLNQIVDAQKLKRVFGVFVLTIGTLMLVKELFS